VSGVVPPHVIGDYLVHLATLSISVHSRWTRPKVLLALVEMNTTTTSHPPSEQLVIRKFSNQDSKQVAMVIKQCLMEINSKDYASHVIQYLVDKYSSEKLLRIAEEDDRQIWVAVDNGRIVGTGSFVSNNPDENVHALFVDPASHGRQIGRKIMVVIEQYALQRGFRSLTLISSITAETFYAINGFKKHGQISSFDRGEGICMSKVLTDSISPGRDKYHSKKTAGQL
jgi:GNAT superfamily N-acetyltransferase